MSTDVLMLSDNYIPKSMRFEFCFCLLTPLLVEVKRVDFAIRSHSPCDGMSHGSWSSSCFDDKTSWRQFKCRDDVWDVSKIQNLSPVRQPHRPEFGCRLQHVHVSFRTVKLPSVLLTDDVIMPQVTKLALEDFSLLHFLNKDWLGVEIHKDYVSIVDSFIVKSQEGHDCKQLVNRTNSVSRNQIHEFMHAWTADAASVSAAAVVVASTE